MTVKIVNDYREAEENEFFFRNDPMSTAGIKDLLVWIEECTPYAVIHIPHWKIETSGGNSYSYGIRSEK